MNQKKIDLYKRAYPAGTRIRLDHMDDPYAPVPDGTDGTVFFVDDLGTIHVDFDNGRSLGICPDVDRFHKIGGDV